MVVIDGVSDAEKRGLLPPKKPGELYCFARDIFIGFILMAASMAFWKGWEAAFGYSPAFRGIPRFWLDSFCLPFYVLALHLTLSAISEEKIGKEDDGDPEWEPRYDSYWEFFCAEPLWALLYVFFIANLVVSIFSSCAIGLAAYLCFALLRWICSKFGLAFDSVAYGTTNLLGSTAPEGEKEDK